MISTGCCRFCYAIDIATIFICFLFWLYIGHFAFCDFEVSNDIRILNFYISGDVARKIYTCNL